MFASHDPEWVKRFCKRMFRLAHGGLSEIALTSFHVS